MNKKTLIFLFTIFVIASVAVVLVYLHMQSDNEEILAQNFAIMKAKEESDLSFFPDEIGKKEGVIYGGGPAPGIEVPGEFETSVEKETEDIYVVTFTERWNSEDFHYKGEDGPILSHFFKFRVNPDGVEGIGEGGDFPPQAVK